MIISRMKMRQRPYSVQGNEGVTFSFNDFDGQHDESLVLKRNGEPVDGAHRLPLYKLQDLDPQGVMVEVTFETYTEKQQTQNDGRRDSVKFRRSLRVATVKPVEEAKQSTNGQQVAGARS